MVCDTLCNCSLFVFAHTQLTDPKRTNSEFVFFNAAAVFLRCVAYVLLSCRRTVRLNWKNHAHILYITSSAYKLRSMCRE